MSKHQLPALPQWQAVLRHLINFGDGISALEAEGVYKIRRLASRVDELRQKGWPVETTMRLDATGQRYARYRIRDRKAAARRYRREFPLEA